MGLRQLTAAHSLLTDLLCALPISFQEFGDSARARKLYEQDSDDDDEDGELEPNPKLEAGEMVQSANGGTDGQDT